MLQGDLAAGLRAVVSQRLLRAIGGGRVPAVEILLNSNLVAELIEKGDFHGVREAMEKSMADGSRSFEDALAHLITTGAVSREEGLSHADSVTNLLWRLQNDMSPVSRLAPKREESDLPEFTDFVVEVFPAGNLPRRPPASSYPAVPAT